MEQKREKKRPTETWCFCRSCMTVFLVDELEPKDPEDDNPHANLICPFCDSADWVFD
jgi:hypothetical protein